MKKAVVCIITILVFTLSLSSCKATANVQKIGIPIADEKTQFNNLVAQFNKESDTYNSDLKNIRNLVVTAGNLLAYTETEELPHENSTVTLNIDGNDTQLYKITSDSKYQSLNDLLNALSEVWADNIIDFLGK